MKATRSRPGAGLKAIGEPRAGDCPEAGPQRSRIRKTDVNKTAGYTKAPATMTEARSSTVMGVSRRDFLKVSSGVAAGTALGGLAGLGANLAPTLARAQELRIKDAKITPSVCPYCAVGCATLVHTLNGKIVSIEGDPR